MPDRRFLKAAEFAEEEESMEALNESLERSRQRELAARAIAAELFEGDNDVDILPGHWMVESPEPQIEAVDGGYWVQARVFVDADLVDARVAPG